MDKTVYRVGEPIKVTALKGTDDDWIGVQLASVSSGTKLWYHLSASGINQAFDITQRSNYDGIAGRDYKFSELEPGKYQLAWLSASKTSFQSGKEAKNMIEFIVVDVSEPLQIGIPFGENSSEPNLSALNDILTDVATLKQAEYTAETWKVLQSAVDTAILVRDNPDHTQAEIDQAYQAISDAILALVAVKPTTQPNRPNVDKNPEETTPENEQNEPTIPEKDTSASANSQNEKKTGCGSTVSSVSLCLLLACVPLVLKKKKLQ